MAEYLVTGGAGFIGSHLVEGLLKQGKKVAVLDNLSTGKKENIALFAKQIIFHKGSICDEKKLLEALAGVRVVFHQAALPSVPRSIADPWTSHQNNSEGTLKVLLAARKAGVQRVVYAASSSAYGNTKILPKVEDMCPLPLSPYACSKLAGEHYCQAFANVYDIETVCLRYFNVFGPRQDAASAYAAVIPKFITALRKNQAPIIYGDGEQTRDFNFIENVVAANFLAAQAKTEDVSGKVFNIACGKRISLNELLAYLQEILGTSILPHFSDSRPGDVRDSLADISNARRYLGYEPSVDVKEGVRQTVAWFESL